MVGSSLVSFGFSPSVIQEEVERELGLEICVVNLGQTRLSSESAVSFLRAVLARSQPEILIWVVEPWEVAVEKMDWNQSPGMHDA